MNKQRRWEERIDALRLGPDDIILLRAGPSEDPDSLADDAQALHELTDRVVILLSAGTDLTSISKKELREFLKEGESDSG